MLIATAVRAAVFWAGAVGVASLVACAAEGPGATSAGGSTDAGTDCPGYGVVASSSFSVSPTAFEARLELAELPDALTFDRLGYADSRTVEYEWSVTIDAFGDGRNGYAFIAENIVEEGEVERSGPILENVTALLTKRIGHYSGSGVLATPGLEVEGNVLVFHVDARIDDDIFNLSDVSVVTGRALVSDGYTYCDMRWP